MCRVTKCHFTRLITGLCGMLEIECFFSMFDAETKKKVENGVRKISDRHRLSGPIHSNVVVVQTVSGRTCGVYVKQGLLRFPHYKNLPLFKSSTKILTCVENSWERFC